MQSVQALFLARLKRVLLSLSARTEVWCAIVRTYVTVLLYFMSVQRNYIWISFSWHRISAISLTLFRQDSIRLQNRLNGHCYKELHLPTRSLTRSCNLYYAGS